MYCATMALHTAQWSLHVGHYLVVEQGIHNLLNKSIVLPLYSRFYSVSTILENNEYSPPTAVTAPAV